MITKRYGKANNKYMGEKYYPTSGVNLSHTLILITAVL